MAMKWMWLALMLTAMPATADVKAGVAAWNRGDYARAVSEWRGPAVAGDADAQFNLGQAYKLGRGVPVDPAAARNWFAKAAQQGHTQAIDNYGLALFQAGDKAAALPWLEKSVARDERRAELVLGTMLFNGDGVTKDWIRAYALVTRSAEQGLKPAAQTLAQLEAYIPTERRQAGLGLAREIEARARSSATAPRDRPVVAASAEPVAPARAEVAAVKPPPRRITPPPPVAGGGGWRVQLGAFREAGNARGLWSQVGGRVGGSPAYVKAGALTRLQATGFASRTEAQRACARAGGGCVVVAP